MFRVVYMYIQRHCCSCFAGIFLRPRLPNHGDLSIGNDISSDRSNMNDTDHPYCISLFYTNNNDHNAKCIQMLGDARYNSKVYEIYTYT